MTVVNTARGRCQMGRSFRMATGRTALGLAGILAAAPLRAQTEHARQSPDTATAVVPATDGAAAINAAEVHRHVSALTHDSLGGRATPSRRLEQTAQYVAAQLKAAGLETAGLASSWVQRYRLPGQATLDDRSSQLTFAVPTRRGKPLTSEDGQAFGVRSVNFHFAAFLASDTVLGWQAPVADASGQIPVLLAGPHTLASVRQANLHDKLVIYVPASGSDSALQRNVIELLRAANHVLVVADEDSTTFALRRRAALVHPPVILEPYLLAARRVHRWVAYAWAPSIEGPLALAGFHLADARTTTVPVVRQLEATLILQVVMANPTMTDSTAPNSIGILPGGDDSHVIMLVANMDHAGRLDHTVGANDNASGVAGLLALAQAFTRADTRPRRSIAFAAVSGGANEFVGSHNLLAQWPALRAGRIMLAINLDMIGRTPGDSIWVDGVSDIELPVRPGWVALPQPGPALTVIDTGTVTAPTSDHIAFVEEMIPSLYIHGAAHGQPWANPGGIPTDVGVDAEQEARVLRFVYALTRALADAPNDPRWTHEGRERRIRALGE